MASAIDMLSSPDHGLVRETRDSQVQMAASIQEVIDNGGVYFAEGPVGLGKTLAYLTPAILAAGRRVVVATAKKGLQDQVYTKDLPHIAKAIGKAEMDRLQLSAGGIPLRLATVVKGKGNYACRLLADKRDPDVTYQDFVQKSKYGDRAEYPGAVPPWWHLASAEDCRGRSCGYFEGCGYIRLKNDVKQSRICVVNHHLLGADMFYGLGKMVGGEFDILIIDEAHKLAEGLRAAFTLRVSQNSIEQLDKVLRGEHSRLPWQFYAPRNLLDTWHEMFEAVPNRHWKESHLRDIPVFPKLADEVLEGLQEVAEELDKVIKLYKKSSSDEDDDGGGTSEDAPVELGIVEQARRKVGGYIEGLRRVQGRVTPHEGEEPEDYEVRKEHIMENTVVYAHGDARGFHVSCAPINLGGIAKSYFQAVKSVIITSATLAIGNDFDHVSEVVGVAPTKCEVLPTSFDYQSQGFLYVPKDIPFRTRSAPDYADSVKLRVQRAMRLCELSQGGAFILTTANDELDEFAIALKKRFPGKVFAQGHSKNDWDGDPQAILKQYLATPNSILVGSKSFWEGVDVQGEQLRLVIIAKLPFPIFNDPIVKARERVVGKENAFHRVQMVDMLTDLRQGAGRLIRSKTDRGVVAILDSRVWEKSYGKQVRAILQFPVVSDMATCEKYLPKFVAYFQRLTQKVANG